MSVHDCPNCAADSNSRAQCPLCAEGVHDEPCFHGADDAPVAQAQAELGDSLVDALDSFIEAAELLAVELDRSRVDRVRYGFNPYHLADLQGADSGAGWLGRGFLIDDVRALRSGKEPD